MTPDQVFLLHIVGGAILYVAFMAGLVGLFWPKR